jgi:Flp pilus assembly protein TadG
MKETMYAIRSRNRGVSIIVVTLSMMVIIPLVGLAIDLSMLYLVRTKLLSAADAAVLAGTRALSQGADAAAQRVSAQTAATKFFQANFPSGFWGTSNLSFPTPGVDDTTNANYRTVSATASVRAPLYFLRVFGSAFSTVAVSAQAARRDALVMIVLDRSSSMERTVTGTGETACSIMVRDTKEFVKHFAQGRDQVGLVVFNAGANRLDPSTNFLTAVSAKIDQIDCNGNTNSAEGLWSAYQAILNVNSSSRANVIVMMTDGIANGFTGDFKPYRKNPSTCGPGNVASLKGSLVQWANFASTGTTAGLMEPAAPNVTGDNVATTVNSTGCYFRSDAARIKDDVSRMPTNDVHGNALAGTYSSYSNAYVSFFGAPADLTQVDKPQDIGRASANALDNMATTIRNNTTLKPMIYTIGLNTDPTGNDNPDPQLLKKMANDPIMARDPAPGPTFYTNQSSQTKGLYVNCPDASQLQAAFDTIATNIVIRLAL